MKYQVAQLLSVQNRLPILNNCNPPPHCGHCFCGDMETRCVHGIHSVIVSCLQRRRLMLKSLALHRHYCSKCHGRKLCCLVRDARAVSHGFVDMAGMPCESCCALAVVVFFAVAVALQSVYTYIRIYANMALAIMFSHIDFMRDTLCA